MTSRASALYACLLETEHRVVGQQKAALRGNVPIHRQLDLFEQSTALLPFIICACRSEGPRPFFAAYTGDFLSLLLDAAWRKLQQRWWRVLSLLFNSRSPTARLPANDEGCFAARLPLISPWCAGRSIAGPCYSRSS
jgi:hypothetical protein